MELTAENYYSAEANKAFFSASQVKSFMKCEAEALAELEGFNSHKDDTALLIGSYVDTYFEGTNAEFKESHPQIFKRDGTLKAEYIKADAMIERAESDTVFMQYCQGDKQHIATGEIEGVPFKAKFDFYIPGRRIVDLKTVKDMKPMYKEGFGKVSPIEYWNWPLQMAIYQELEGNKLPCYLAIITKEDPASLYLYQVDQKVMDAEMEILRDKIHRFQAIKEGFIEPNRCEDCAWCRSSKVLNGPELFTYMEEEE